MHDMALAFLWHQHQPYYPDDVAGINPMPWVRLHGTKDYWGMAMHLKEVPELHCTINLVPSLLAQIKAYTDAGHEDEHLRISRLPADALSEADIAYLLDNFFMVHPDQMIRPFPRYHELYQQRGLAVDPAADAARRFSTRDLLDLQCWGNLAWIHPLAFELDSELAEFRKKGSRWTESEKQWLLARQMELLAEVIPLHKMLADRGQIELTTTPFYHPILPLLCDKRAARQAMPDVTLPQYLEGYPEDAVEQIRRAVDYHKSLFGRKPRGMWPSEGSVSQQVIGPIAEAGIQWIATDEEILSGSLGGQVGRDANGFLRQPELLYRPWLLEQRGKRLSAIFRDHAMSDQIGFHYQRYPAAQAADDFIGKLEAIGAATAAHRGERPALVSIILDGENCWEYYPNGGVEFLRTLYRQLVAHERIKTVRISDYLKSHPPTDKIENLFAGSWISHNFAIWIGHPECNRAWDLLFETRRFLVTAEKTGGKTAEQYGRAWDEVLIAEGSDWFWWFGDSHSSAQDELFDQLFRKHLQNVYLLLEEQPPAELYEPIRAGRQAKHAYTEPTGLLTVKINGRQTYFEWINAGHYVASGSRGTMSMVERRVVEELYYGFDTERLFLRLDGRGESIRDTLSDIESLRVVFLKPAGYELVVTHLTEERPTVELRANDLPMSGTQIEAASDSILEIAIPWRHLGLKVDLPLEFYLELTAGGQTVERLPIEGTIDATVPSEDFELLMWQA